MALLEGAAQRRAVSQQVLLADELAERAGPQADGERRRLLRDTSAGAGRLAL